MKTTSPLAKAYLKLATKSGQKQAQAVIGRCYLI